MIGFIHLVFFLCDILTKNKTCVSLTNCFMLQYQEDSDVEALVNKLLAILDRPEKALLLRDIR